MGRDLAKTCFRGVGAYQGTPSGVPLSATVSRALAPEKTMEKGYKQCLVWTREWLPTLSRPIG